MTCLLRARKRINSFQRVTEYNVIEGTVLPKNFWELSRGWSWEEGGEVRQGYEAREEENRVESRERSFLFSPVLLRGRRRAAKSQKS